MKRRLVPMFLAVFALGGALAQDGGESAGSQDGQQDRTIADIVAEHPDLTMLHEILQDAELLESLRETPDVDSEESVEEVGVQGITLFAPSNAALESLSEAELQQYRNNEDGSLLNRLVVQDDFTLEQLRATPDSEAITFAVRTDGEGNVMINDATIVEADLIGVNGIVHIVDRIPGAGPVEDSPADGPESEGEPADEGGQDAPAAEDSESPAGSEAPDGEAGSASDGSEQEESTDGEGGETNQQ